MSTQEQTVFDVTIIERTEVLHKGFGVVEKINRDVLFDGKVSAVGDISAQNQALDKIKAPLPADTTLDYDKLEITCKPF